MKKIVVNLVLAVIAVCSTSLQAQQHKHEHGVAELNLVIDGNSLQIEFESPAANIVGFEHEAETEEEKSAIANAIKILHNSDNLFTLPAAAGCKLRDSDVELHGDDEEHEDRAEYGEDEEHEEHTEHDHDSEHSEFHAQYVYECKNAVMVTYLGLPLFKRFPSVEEVHLQALTPRGQIGAEIEADEDGASLE